MKNCNHYKLILGICALVLFGTSSALASIEHHPPNNSNELEMLSSCDDGTEIAYWSLDDCESYGNDGTNYDYSELTATTYAPAGFNSVNATNLTGEGPHSCLVGASGSAFCHGGRINCGWVDNSSDAVSFTVTVNPANGSNVTLTELSFYQMAPLTYSHLSGNTGDNDPPSHFGFRVLKNGQEIYQNTGNNTTHDWTLEEFNLSNDPDFTVSSTTTFKFELLGYCRSNGSFGLSVWDLDEIKLFGCSEVIDPCASQGGDSDNDGICDDQDCHPNDPFYPATPGTLCNDGNPNTVNDVVSADGCDCLGAALPTLTINNITVVEEVGMAMLTVTTSAPSPSNITVAYTTSNGTAVSGSDYTPVTGTVTIPAGQTSATISIPVVNDNTPEGTESLTVTLFSPSGATIADNTGTVTITDNDFPALTINDVTVVEEVGMAMLTVTTSAPSPSNITVAYTTSNGTAVSGSDYTPVTGTVTIPAGQTSATISIPVVNDNTPEGTESLTVTLSSPSGATIADNTGMVTITDNDFPALTINDITVVEEVGMAMLTVTTSAPSPSNITVAYTTSNGTAVSGSDYTPVTGTVTIPAGQTSATISIPVVNDNSPEPTESLTVTLSSPSGATIADNTGMVTITDNDFPALTINDITVVEEVGMAMLTVTTSAPSPSNITVAYTTSNGTAVSGSDYTPVSGTVTIPAGQTSATILIPVVDDNIPEDAESLTVTLSSPSGATIADNTGTVTITDSDQPVPACGVTTGDCSITITGLNSSEYAKVFNSSWSIVWECNPWVSGGCNSTETISGLNSGTYYVQACGATNPYTVTCGGGPGMPSVSINDVTVVEEAGTATLTVTTSAPSTSNITVAYTTSNGTAVGGSDYTPVSGTVTIPAGQTSATISIPVVDDNTPEDTESLTVTLSSPSGATIADETGTVTITDSDQPGPGCGVTTGDCSITITGLNSSEYAKVFNSSWSIVWECNPWVSGGCNSTETISGLNSGTYYVQACGATNPYTVTCGGGPGMPSVSINDVTVDEDAGVATLTISSSAPSSSNITVTYGTMNGTAVSGSDYTPVSGTATIPAGQTSTTISVPIIYDNEVEVTETLVVNLSNPSGATIADGTGMISILDKAQPGPGCGVTTGDCSITITGLNSSEYAKVFDSSWSIVWECNPWVSGGCNSTETISGLNSGTYYVQACGATNPYTVTCGGGPGMPSVSVNDVTVVEEAGTATLTVTTSAPSTSNITVAYTTSNGTAVSGSDYTPVSGTVTIPAGQTSGTISIPVVDDNTPEDTESLTVTLSSPSGATIADNTGTVTITDSDQPVPACGVTTGDCSITITGLNSSEYAKVFNSSWSIVWECNPWVSGGCNSTETISGLNSGTYYVQACGATNPYTVTCGGGPGMPSVSINDVTVVEEAGTATLTVTTSAPSTSNITVAYTTSNGTAVGGSDYTPVSGTVTIPAGQTSATISIPVVDDNTPEDTESLTVTLSSPSGATIADNTGTVTITDNDSPTLTINDVTVIEEVGTAMLTVTTSVPSTSNITVAYTTSNGTAVSGSDYTPVSGTVTIPAGQTSATISIPVVDDNTPEDTESLTVTLSSPSGATIADNTGTVTITDSDQPVPACGVTIGDCSITITGLNSSDYAKVFDSNWQIVWECNPWVSGGCNSTETITDLTNGIYHVQACGSTTTYTISGCAPVDPCAGQGGDSDGDGVCDNQDCQPNNPAFPATPGTACNDGDPNTENDVVTADGCGCAGIVPDPCAGQGGDSDNDGVCDNQDCQPNNPAFPATPGTACNDGDPNTENDVVTADGCGCAGIVPDPCAGQGGDSDNDGVCDNQDCQPNNPVYPATPGTACNDGDPNTENDVVTADGCGCAGIVPDPCAGQGGDSDNDGVCDNQDCQPNNPVYPATPGTACNDGDPNTENDVVTADGCGCAGVVPSPCLEVTSIRRATNLGSACQDESDRVVWLSGGTTYRETGDLYFIEYSDNTAKLKGTIKKNGGYTVWNVDVTFTGKTYNSSPYTGDCGTSSQSNSWYYYSDFSGTIGSHSIHERGHNFQIGYGANVMNNHYGASGWWTRNGVDGDFNFNLTSTIACTDDNNNGVIDVCESGSNLEGEGEHLLFTAVKDQRDVLLSWVTNTDYKNDYFEVEHSTDGINFALLEEVMSASDSEDYRDYRKSDKDAQVGMNYYRVKQVFNDGTFIYSEVRAVAFDLDVNQFTIYPNPTADDVFVNLKDFVGNAGTIQIVNSLGQTVYSQEMDAIPSDPIRISTQNMSSGVHAVSVQLEGKKTMTELLMIVKR